MLGRSMVLRAGSAGPTTRLERSSIGRGLHVDHIPGRSRREARGRAVASLAGRSCRPGWLPDHAASALPGLLARKLAMESSIASNQGVWWTGALVPFTGEWKAWLR